MFKNFLKFCTSAGLVLFVLSAVVVFYVKFQTKSLKYDNISTVPERYVAIIFGAGIRRDGTPGKYLEDRLDAGIALYKSAKVKRLLLSGDNGSKSYDELEVMKKYCLSKGVPGKDIFVDYAGFDTYSTVYRAKDLFKVDNAVMVTQAYHLDRALFIAKKRGIDAVGYAADKGSYKMHRKNKVRERLAIVKSFIDVNMGRKPKYHGGNIPISGPSNYDKK